MKIPKLKKWQLIEVLWVDSIHGSGWVWEDDVAAYDDQLGHRTAGYFFREEKQSIVIVQSVGTPIEGSRTTDARMAIPKIAITKIRKLA